MCNVPTERLKQQACSMRARVEIGSIGSGDGGTRRVASLRYVGRANVSPARAHHRAPGTKSKRSFEYPLC